MDHPPRSILSIPNEILYHIFSGLSNDYWIASFRGSSISVHTTQMAKSTGSRKSSFCVGYAVIVALSPQNWISGTMENFGSTISYVSLYRDLSMRIVQTKDF